MTKANRHSVVDPGGHLFDQIKLAAGERLHEIMESSEKSIMCISDDDPSIRAAAVMAGYAVWDLGEDRGFREKCYLIATNDSDEEPRSAAVAVIASILENSRDHEAQSVLARIFKDSRASTVLRNEAYRALRVLEFGWSADSPMEAVRDSQRLLAGQIVPFASIDWDFVSHLSDRGGKGDGGQGDA